MRYNAIRDFTVIDRKGNKQQVKKGDVLVEYGVFDRLFLNYTSNSNTYFL